VYATTRRRLIPIAGIAILTGPTGFGDVGRGVEGDAARVGWVGCVVGLDLGLDALVVGRLDVAGADGGDDWPAGSVSLHPASAVSSTNAPASLTLRR
jgi:hypothetical protein